MCNRRFFYSPSIYSTSNQQFTRDTVREFYKRFGASCPAEDARTQLLIQQNSVMKQKCGSVLLQKLRDALQLCRSVVDDFIEIAYDMLNIQVDLLSLLAPLSEAYQQNIANDLMYWFKQLVTDSLDALVQAAHLIFRVVMDLSPFGQAMVRIVQMLCETVQWFLENIWRTFLCRYYESILPPLIDITKIVLRALQAFIEGIERFANFFGANLHFSASIQVFIDQLDSVKNMIQDGALNCDSETRLQCMWDYHDDRDDEPNLPVASRCWAGFQPEAGDPAALSCSRADTCNTADLSGAVVCDQCPINPADEFMSFACSPATKKCTCGVQRFERTQCKSHSDCYSYMYGASCMMISSIFSTAYSTVPCSQCQTQQICVVTAQDQPGYCACPMQVSKTRARVSTAHTHTQSDQ